MSTTTDVSNLVINKLTRQQYDNTTPSATELYFITDDPSLTYEEVEESSNPVIGIAGGGTNASTAQQAILNLGIYPIGSLYMTTSSSFNPNTSFGGTWTLVTGTQYTWERTA